LRISWLIVGMKPSPSKWLLCATRNAQNPVSLAATGLRVVEQCSALARQTRRFAKPPDERPLTGEQPAGQRVRGLDQRRTMPTNRRRDPVEAHWLQVESKMRKAANCRIVDLPDVEGEQ
jgi:hypothetical protein